MIEQCNGKDPWRHEPIRQLTKAEREARKAFRQVEADIAMSDHDAAQKAFGENREQLKAERLAREAASPDKSIQKNKG